jgi:hypothetical protein
MTNCLQRDEEARKNMKYLVVWLDSDGYMHGEREESLSGAKFTLKRLFYDNAPDGYRYNDLLPYLEWVPQDKVVEADGDIYASDRDYEGMKMRDRAHAVENMRLEEDDVFLTEEEAFIDAGISPTGERFTAKIFAFDTK